MADSEVFACQGCKEPMRLDDTTLTVVIGRVAMRFCCFACLSTWTQEVHNAPCQICRGDGIRCRAARRSRYFADRQQKEHEDDDDDEPDDAAEARSPGD